MSLADFQRAFAVVVVNPEVWAAHLARPGAGVRDLDLSDRERERLRGILLHRGMPANHLQLRANRWMPIQSALPLTADWLRCELGAVLDAWLEASEDASVQYQREAARFAAWLPAFLASQRRQPPPALDALCYERALAQLAELVTTYGDSATVDLGFRHDPDAVLRGWSAEIARLKSPIVACLRIVDGKVVLDSRGRRQRPKPRTKAADPASTVLAQRD